MGSVADIVQDGDRIYGSGVNVAARIEGLAEPGGVCISRNAFDHIKDHVKLGYEYLGEHDVKNIKDPVRVYKILMDPDDAGKLIGVKPRKAAGKWIWSTAAVFVILLAVIGYEVYQKMSAPEFEPASTEKMSYPLPVEPSIAVLPFNNMTGNPDNEYFSDGITEQIITSLSNIPFLFIIARNSTFVYKNKPVKIHQIAEELGVQYVLEGSVQQSGKRVRITAQLIDAINGHHLWAESYDREMQSIFNLYDDITLKIVAELQGELPTADLGRASSVETENLKAYERYLKGYTHLWNRTIGDTLEARKLAQESIELDPQYGAAYRLLALTYIDEIYLHKAEDRAENLEKADQLLKKAIEHAGYDSQTHEALSNLYYLKREFDKAISEGQKAVELNPNSAHANFIYGMVLSLSARYDQAIPVLEKAIRLNPVRPINYLNQLAFAYAYTDQYEKAITLWEETLERDFDYYYGLIGLTATYQITGKENKARLTADELIKVRPNFTVAEMRKRSITSDREGLYLFCDALLKAGLPEFPPGKESVNPSIAVLPFVNMSNDPDQEYFSDGISEDIITDLSKISGLIVIARNSSFAYKGKSVNIQQIGQDLRVRYLLEGSVRKAGDQVRINAQLIDAANGQHLWAERYDGKMDDVFALQDKITRKIIFALALKLTKGEQKALIDKGTDNIQAYDEFLKGWQGYRLLTSAGFAEAKIHLEKAVELDPNFARAYAALAVLYWKAIQYATPELRQGLGLTNRAAKNAVRAKPQLLLKKAMKKPTALAHGLMSQFYLLRYQRDEALAEIERAIAMDPNDPELYAWMSNIFWFMGKNSEAIESAKMGLRLDPNNPTTYLIQLGKAYLPDGDLQESLQVLERAKRLTPELSGSVALSQSIIYGIQGRTEESRTAYEIFLKSRLSPVRNLNDILLYFPFAEPKKLDRIADALIKAGVPGNPTDYYRILKENRINGQEIKSLLFGRKITGTAMSTGKQLWWEWTKSGDFKWIMGSFQDMGKSWVEGDVLFIQFKKNFGGLPFGTTIYRNPNGSRESKDQYFMVSDFGSITPFAPIGKT